MALVFTLCVICVICGLQRPMTSAARPQVRLNRTAAHGLPGRWGPQISQIIQIIGGGGDAGGSCAHPLRYPSNLWFTTSDDIGGPPSGQVEPNRSPRFVRTVGPTDHTDYWGCGDAEAPAPTLCLTCVICGLQRPMTSAARPQVSPGAVPNPGRRRRDRKS